MPKTICRTVRYLQISATTQERHQVSLGKVFDDCVIYQDDKIKPMPPPFNEQNEKDSGTNVPPWAFCLPPPWGLGSWYDLPWEYVCNCWGSDFIQLDARFGGKGRREDQASSSSSAGITPQAALWAFQAAGQSSAPLCWVSEKWASCLLTGVFKCLSRNI